MPRNMSTRRPAARQLSQCPRCGRTIRPGQRIAYLPKYARWLHARCVRSKHNTQREESINEHDD